MSERIDFTARMAQEKLKRLDNAALSAQLADTAIAIAYRMNTTPQNVLAIAAGKVGFTEEEWRAEVRPELESFLAPKPPDPERIAAIAACPTPIYHETHRYCPSCPWTEAYEEAAQ